MGRKLFKTLFKKSSSPQDTQGHVSPLVGHDVEGLRYRAPSTTTARWLATPFDFGNAADLGARLAILLSEGYGLQREAEFELSWADLYAVLRHPDLREFREALLLPPETIARPGLTSRGALMDAEFTVLLDAWVDAQGKPLVPAPRLTGRVLEHAGSATLVPESVHLLLGELERFHAATAAERSLAFKEQAFGRMRRLAVEAGCPVSDYVARTIVLTPERLRLRLRQHGVGEAKVIEVMPGFDEAPMQWLSQFDRLPLRDSYDVPDGPSLARVVLTPEVRAVLAEIKRMPGRRATGPRAEAFVRNPFAILGEDAHHVLSVEAFEQAREDAGLSFSRFGPYVERGERGEVVHVGLHVQAVGQGNDDVPDITFDDPDRLARFTDRLHRCLSDGSQCIAWMGKDLELDGDAQDHLARLEGWLKEWSSPALWTAAEVLDLSHYSDRIKEIGFEKPFITPVIARNDNGMDWFEGNVSIGLRIEPGANGEATVLPVKFADIPSLQQAVAQADKAGQPGVRLPGLTVPVPLKDAKLAIEALLKAQTDLGRREFKPPVCGATAQAKKRLVIKRNLESVDYTEARATALQTPVGSEPRLPTALRPEVVLKPHQHEGIAWLQHLWEASPDHCRGTLLADDMGLGKTLQLLTLIAAAFEVDPDLPPALVVAPVALLENWRNELERFFVPGTLPLLLLYGDALRLLRVPKNELDAELKAQGVTRLLKKQWIGSAKLVLTTYETMRDLEFALASQPWSIMVCDEAQKIKTPAALVTRSAKKQKVRFRIACTGTPVENTLADLWCLFDFIQPGMLGALNHFSRTYRQPIEAKTNEQVVKVEELRALIQPQILRRRKSEVAKDLPAPIEHAQCKRLPMSDYQQQLYERALGTLREQRDTNPSAQLQALLAIRQICSDPHGFAEPDSRRLSIDRLLNESPKLGWMVERLKALASDLAGDHKVIVFCEFRELQLLLQRVIAAFFGFAPSIVNGDTSADPRMTENRQALIDNFQRESGFNAIILSPLAVGFGVNIQGANHVIHFTRTWNPAKEDQATARAHRIGQTRVVTVYYPGVVSDNFPSFDVRLDALLTGKRALAADMLNGCSDLKAADFADFG
jgi:hypothetical protein